MNEHTHRNLKEINREFKINNISFPNVIRRSGPTCRRSLLCRMITPLMSFRANSFQRFKEVCVSRFTRKPNPILDVNLNTI